MAQSESLEKIKPDWFHGDFASKHLDECKTRVQSLISLSDLNISTEEDFIVFLDNFLENLDSFSEFGIRSISRAHVFFSKELKENLDFCPNLEGPLREYVSFIVHLFAVRSMDDPVTEIERLEDLREAGLNLFQKKNISEEMKGTIWFFISFLWARAEFYKCKPILECIELYWKNFSKKQFHKRSSERSRKKLIIHSINCLGCQCFKEKIFEKAVVLHSSAAIESGFLGMSVELLAHSANVVEDLLQGFSLTPPWRRENNNKNPEKFVRFLAIFQNTKVYLKFVENQNNMRQGRPLMPGQNLEDNYSSMVVDGLIGRTALRLEMPYLALSHLKMSASIETLYEFKTSDRSTKIEWESLIANLEVLRKISILRLEKEEDENERKSLCLDFIGDVFWVAKNLAKDAKNLTRKFYSQVPYAEFLEVFMQLIAKIDPKARLFKEEFRELFYAKMQALGNGPDLATLRPCSLEDSGENLEEEEICFKQSKQEWKNYFEEVFSASADKHLESLVKEDLMDEEVKQYFRPIMEVYSANVGKHIKTKHGRDFSISTVHKAMPHMGDSRSPFWSLYSKEVEDSQIESPQAVSRCLMRWHSRYIGDYKGFNTFAIAAMRAIKRKVFDGPY